MSGPAGSALVAPVAIGVATVASWLVAGAESALVVLSTLAVVLVAFHLRHQALVRRWAEGPLDAPVPEARGSWRPVFDAIHRRVRSRAEHQRELRDTIERFRRAADAIPDGVVVLDESNAIEWANPSACVQLGLDLSQDRGAPIGNLLRRPEFQAYLDAGDFSGPVLVAGVGDARSTLSLQMVPYGVRERLLLSRDVTRLEAVARMRRDFIANVSHELKTPLTVIAGFVETMQDLDLDAPQRGRYLALMHDQARNMQRLVSDLLTLSALESEHEPAGDDRFDVAALLRELSADAEALSAGNHRIVLDPGDPASISGSREEIASAFANLVSNAVRYTPTGGRISLAWRVDADGRGLLSVTDTGVGIAPEHLPRLTERFYRVDRSRSRATGGTGLGLAIVKHVLIRHQAELEIDSRPGEGSTFTIRLPARRVQRGAPLAGAPSASPAPTAD
ncbi:MAG: phosphate regulon sensor histidine kinase PhoR [Burkholderiales bacterium]